jgi:hypothetical protein
MGVNGTIKRVIYIIYYIIYTPILTLERAVSPL